MIFTRFGLNEAERALAALKLMDGDSEKGISGFSKYAAKSMTGASEATMDYVKTLGVAAASELTFSQLLKLGTKNIKENTEQVLNNIKTWAKSPMVKGYCGPNGN